MKAQQTLGLAEVLRPLERFRLTKRDSVEWLRSLPPESLDLIVTDPAYESLEKHRAKGTTTRLKVSDASSNEWFPIFPNTRFPDLFAAAYRALKVDTHFYVMCDQETAFVAKPMAEAAGFKFWKPLVWDKVSIGMGYHYRARYELVLFFEKGKRQLNDLGVPDVLSIPRVQGLHCDNCQRTNLCGEREGQGASIPRDTSSSQPETEGTGSPTSLSGSDITDQSRPECRSTTKTRTSKTTRSKTSNSSTRQRTSDSIADANCATPSGGSHAGSARASSPSPQSIGISTPMADGRSSDVVDLATFERSSSASSGSACPHCGNARRGVYATEKPVALSQILIKQSTETGAIVADPFMGSASVGAAALTLNRRFLGCDVSDDAMSLALARLRKLLGSAPKQNQYD